MPVIAPCRQNVISPFFSKIIEWAFSGRLEIDLVLGGSCALTEFYLSHRIPEDVDFFVGKKEDMKIFKAILSQSYTIRHEEVIKQATDYKYVVEVEGRDVPVHCVFSSTSWAEAGIRRRYTVRLESISLHTLDFIGAAKLSFRRRDSPLDCTKKVLDLYFIRSSGVTVYDLLSVLRSRKVDPSNLTKWPYRRPCYDKEIIQTISLKDISIHQVDIFVEQFKEEIREALREPWITASLEELIKSETPKP